MSLIWQIVEVRTFGRLPLRGYMSSFLSSICSICQRSISLVSSNSRTLIQSFRARPIAKVEHDLFEDYH